MGIKVSENGQIFTLHTKASSYQMGVSKYGHLLHLHYGGRISGSMEYLILHRGCGFAGNPYETGLDQSYTLDLLPQEYSVYGNGDFRTSALVIKDEHGSYSCDLRFRSYEIVKEKYGLPGLPATYDQTGETLKIHMEDPATDMQAILYYGVFEDLDIITRAVKIINQGEKKIYVEKVASACLDFLAGQFDIIDFHGRHAMERTMQRHPLVHGIHSIGSSRGHSSHHYNPFMILCESETTEDAGSCYGMSFVYSGCFKGEVECDQMNQIRMVMGIQDERFSCPLQKGEEFITPEVVMSYSSKGLTQLSQNYHEIYRHHLCRGYYKTRRRPILINNWEATYFDFTGEKICEIARQAAELGVEMLVLDDGWFGKRNGECSGLGDWFVNEEKMGGTIADLSVKIHQMGLKFGLWVEPEMVSEDSDLYRAHPDWAFTVPGRKPIRSRYQLVLDFSRKEVVDHIFEMLTTVLDSTDIEYIKWDMNRSLTDVYSAAAEYEEQGMVLHRYMLGVYDLLERLIQRYPHMLIEGCSGGGGRFDAGMLYYTPQIWCSDNTDAIDRVSIQYGTSFGYPVSAVGAHISAVPNHQTGREIPLATRAVVAMSGSFGYELNLNSLNKTEKEQIKKWNELFYKYWPVIHEGEYFRLTDPLQNRDFAAWEFVSKNKDEVLLNVVSLSRHGNQPTRYVKLKGLIDDAQYRIDGQIQTFFGSDLMNGGMRIPELSGEYDSWQMYLKRME